MRLCDKSRKSSINFGIYGNIFANPDLLNVFLQVANTALTAVILYEGVHGGRIKDNIRVLQTR